MASETAEVCQHDDSVAQSGKQERLSSIFNEQSNNTIIVALDDSSITGPEHGLRDMEGAVRTAVEHEADAILGFYGLFKNYPRLTEGTAGILNLTLSTGGPDHLSKVLIGRVEQVANSEFGLAAASVHVNTTSPNERTMLGILGLTAAYCDDPEVRVPLLAHMYPRRIKDGHEDHYDTLKAEEPEEYAKLVRNAARIAADLGADIIKVPFTGSAETFQTVVESAYGLPVVMAGGPKIHVPEFMHNAHAAMEAGARGIAVGRNFFEQESHHEGGLVLSALHRIVHSDYTPQDALGEVGLIYTGE